MQYHHFWGQSCFIKVNGEAPNLFVSFSLWRAGSVTGPVTSLPVSLFSMGKISMLLMALLLSLVLCVTRSIRRDGVFY